jgi:hypothetical protein
MEWILSLFFRGHDQRSRTSFVNTCTKKNFGLKLTNKCGNKLEHENEAKGPGPEGQPRFRV